jgi:PAS domain S-box-containing protein
VTVETDGTASLVVSAAEERLRLALEAGEMGTWEWRVPEGRVLWSPTLERIHGLEPGTFGGTIDDYWRDIHPDDHALVRQTVERTFAGSAHRLRYRIIRPDGELRCLEARGTLLRDDAGAPLRLIGICSDVTERERADEQLQFLSKASAILASSLDYRTTVTQVAQLLVPKLADWCAVQLLDENAVLQVLALANVDPAKLQEAHELARRYSNPNASSQSRIASVLASAEAERYAEVSDELLRSVAQDDGHLEVLRRANISSLMLLPLVARERVLGVMSLVATESRRKYSEVDQAFAQELARRAATAIDNSRLFGEARSAADRTARLLSVTDSLARALTVGDVAQTIVRQGMTAFGAESGSLCLLAEDGHSLEIVHSAGLPEKIRNDFRRFSLEAPIPAAHAVRTQEPLFFENRAALLSQYPSLREANRQATAESWVAIPVVFEGSALGAISFGLPTARPFTPEDRALGLALAQQCAQALERARLHEAERLARARADEANRVKTEFLAVMSHELRTPLNAIAGYAELLELGVHGPLSEAQREAIGRIRRSQRHLLGLINDVLNFARLDAGHVELLLSVVPVHETLAALETLVAPQVRARQLTYVYERCDPALTVETDPEKLRQILLNLLSNAIKFTDAGGRISVTCRNDEKSVRIQVSDTGRGIPADKLGRIFEPFVQLDAGRTRTSEGTGLGLAISRDLARAMGGEIMVESELGQGSRFTLVLGR